MDQAKPILYWNRKTGKVEQEQVYGDAGISFLYQTKVGNAVADLFMSKKLPSRLYGLYQSSQWSRHKIENFIRDYRIDMSEFEPGPFDSFNDFFIRGFRPGARQFVRVPNVMAAFAEARYLAYESIGLDQTFPVKGSCLTPEALLGNSKLATRFNGGPLLLARLCPTDYHRFHYLDGGTTEAHYGVPGALHSVNPHALEYKSEIFCTNERRVSLLQTENFGVIAYVEVGAMAVGKIVQTHPADRSFSRGDEKGYFLFGASTVIVFGEKGKWIPSRDLLEQSAQRRETLVRLGEPVTD